MQRSDLFAFGILLYEMLTGRHPWPRPSAVDTLHAILHDDPPPMDASPHGRRGPRRRCTDAAAQAPRGAVPVGRSGARSPRAPVRRPRIFHGERGEPDTSHVHCRLAVCLPERCRRQQSAVAGVCGCTHYDPRQSRGCGGRSDIGDPELRRRYRTRPGLPRSGRSPRPAGERSRSWVPTGASRCRCSMRRRRRVTLSEKHDFDLDNVFEVQDEIGRRVAESLHSRFPSAVPKSRDRYSSDPEAYNEFMAGLRESSSDGRKRCGAPPNICPAPSSATRNSRWRMPRCPSCR